MAKKLQKEVVRVGTKRFLKKVNQGQTVTVTTKDWINYHEARRQDDKRARQEEVVVKDREIERLYRVVDESDKYSDLLRNERANLRLDLAQAQGNFEAARTDKEGFRDLAILALLPLAAIFGSSALQIIMVTLAKALGHEDSGKHVSHYFNQIGSTVGELSGKLNDHRPLFWQRLSHLITNTRYELQEISKAL